MNIHNIADQNIAITTPVPAIIKSGFSLIPPGAIIYNETVIAIIVINNIHIIFIHVSLFMHTDHD